MILDAVEWTAGALLASVDWCVRGTTDVKLSKGVIFDLDCISRRTFAGSLDSPGLYLGQWDLVVKAPGFTYSLLKFGICALFNKCICKPKSTAKLLVLVCKVHGGEERKRLVLWVHAWNGKVCRELEDALSLVLRQ